MDKFNVNEPDLLRKQLVIAYEKFPEHGFLVMGRMTTGPAFCRTEQLYGVSVDIFRDKRLRLGEPAYSLLEIASEQVVVGTLSDYTIINPEKFDEWANNND